MPILDLPLSHHYLINQYNEQEFTTAFLNISNANVDDGGRYSCVAENNLGRAVHSARLNIYGMSLLAEYRWTLILFISLGQPFIRAIGPVKAFSGETVKLYCPYSGYPIHSIKWMNENGEQISSCRFNF
jgi:hypothetical protein